MSSLLLPVVCFVLGLAASAFWFTRAGRPVSSASPGPELSMSTKAILGRVSQPIEIHFYSLLDSSAPAPLGAFAQHAGRLLGLYQQQADGKIVVTGLGPQTNSDPNLALEDGIRGFDFDQGQGCYLGMAFLSEGRKEVLPQLSPDWEPALEADISRAIQRLVESSAGARRAVGTNPVPANVIAEVRQRVPNLDSLSLDDAIRLVREDSVKEFSSAAAELQTRVQEAQAHLGQAQRSGSAAEQDAAIKNLQGVQAEQARRLKQIAADAQSRIDALKQFKPGAP